MRLGKRPAIGRPAGGFDGVLVSFGDGCDNSTWEGLFGHLAGRDPYSVRLTWKDGTQHDAQVLSWPAQVDGDDEWHLAYEVRDGEADWPLNPTWERVTTRRLSELVGVHIY